MSSDPPTSQPTIEDNSNGKVLQDGDTLDMSCTVRGGRPLVKSVDFFCPGQPDQNDIVGIMYKQRLLLF